MCDFQDLRDAAAVEPLLLVGPEEVHDAWFAAVLDQAPRQIEDRFGGHGDTRTPDAENGPARNAHPSTRRVTHAKHLSAS